MIEVEYIAQSGFILRSEDTIIAIDPWLDNPINPIDQKKLDDMNHIFITHDHDDHGLESAIEIASNTDAKIIAQYDLSNWLKNEKGLGNVVGGNMGGFFEVDDLLVKYVNATHSSNVGWPVGYMIKMGENLIYHMGDTGYQSDFEKLGDMYDIDILFVPIGSLYTMDPYEASYAVSDLDPKFVVPIHYNTFDKIKQDPEKFIQLVKERDSKAEVVIMQPGDNHKFEFVKTNT